MATSIPASKVLTFSNGSTSTVTHSWSVTQLSTRNEGANSDAVVHVQWLLTATDETGNEGSFRGATPVTTKGSTSTFVAFSELDETTVLGWVKDVVIGHYADHIQEQIFEQLDRKVNAINLEAPLPWATTPPEAPPV